MAKKEAGKTVRSTSSGNLPAALKKPTGKPGEVKVTVENAPLVIVQLLSEIRNQNAKILKYFEEAANGRS